MHQFGELPPEIREQQELQIKFDSVLKGKFGMLIGGNFRSELAGIESVSIIPPELKEGQTEPESLNIVVWYKGKNEVERNVTMSLKNNGDFFGKLPPPLNKQITKEGLLREILQNYETIGLEQWVKVDFDIFPPGSREETEGTGGPKKDSMPSVIDPKRIAFIEQQQGFLFGFANSEKGGFDGYRAFVFRSFVFLEHPMTQNGAYFLEIPVIDQNEIPKDPQKIADWIKKQSWAEILRTGRMEARKKGASVRVHSGESWEKRMQDEIKERISALS